MSVFRPHFECTCSARQPDIISKSIFCAIYRATNNSSNCARIANVCRVQQVCEKNVSVEITVSIYWVKAYQPITNKPVGSGLTSRAERYRPGNIIVIVPA